MRLLAALIARKRTLNGILSRAIGLFLAAGLVAAGWPMGQVWGAVCDGNDPSTFQQCRRMAESGDPAAMNGVGYMYDTGKGVRRDARDAVRWYRKAAENGSGYGMFNLGVQYRDGEGVPKDQREAARWFFKAADKGVADAYYSLAQAHEGGSGVAGDHEAAAGYMLKSVRRGYDFSVREMTTNAAGWGRKFRRALQRLLREEGVYTGAIDGSFGPATKRAVKTLAARARAQDSAGRKPTKDTAAQAGSAEITFWESVHDSKNPVELEAYLKAFPTGKFVPMARLRLEKLGRAAPSGQDAIAIYRRGLAYMEGRGVPKDYAQAAKWLRKAASLGVEDTNAQLRILGYEPMTGKPASTGPPSISAPGKISSSETAEKVPDTEGLGKLE